MNKRRKIALSLVLLAVLLIGYWFYNNYNWVTEKQTIGFQGLAKKNHLLAADFFLRKMGISTHQINNWSEFRDLPSSKHTLLITTQTTINLIIMGFRLTQSDDLFSNKKSTLPLERSTNNSTHKKWVQPLLAWVESGGHIIIEAKYLFKGASDIESTVTSSALSLSKELLNDWSLFSTYHDVVNNDLPIPFFLNDTENKKAINVNFPYDITLMRTPSDKPLSSDKIPIWTINDDTAQYLMQFSVGKGLLTVLTSTSMFKNRAIDDYDHAQFLHYLVQLPEHDAGVWLINVDDIPSLWQWLWNNAWMIILSVVCLLFLWLWRVPFRFGPVLNDIPLERRRLLEHIKASGYYHWDNNEASYLLKQVQQRLWGQIRRMHPSIPQNDRLHAYQMLSDLTGIKQTLIQKALLKEETISDSQFTEKIQMLELIRAKL
ncbi:MAG: hypothetical protein KAI02_03555 [Gammaproteobacteria bacterium]|nr:hypothetical protein [Gammaproteobacteria bacterium]